MLTDIRQLFIHIRRFMNGNHITFAEDLLTSQVVRLLLICDDFKFYEQYDVDRLFEFYIFNLELTMFAIYLGDSYQNQIHCQLTVDFFSKILILCREHELSSCQFYRISP